MKVEPEKLPYDPFRGSETVTLQELLDDLFEEELEDGASFIGENSLTVNSGSWVGGDRPLHEVARRGNARCIQLLLESGADPNLKGEDSFTPLEVAVSRGYLDVARLLLEAGARIDSVNELNYSALGCCSPNGYKPNPEMFDLLQSYWPGVIPHEVRG